MSFQLLILCGGKGERLKPLTENIPKPLVKIKDNTILGHIINHLSFYNIKDIIVATGYKSEKIKEYIKNNHSDLNLKIVDSGDVDIIQRIKDSVPYIKDDIILLYGDTLSDVNIDDLVRFHHKQPGKATITVWPLHSQFGVLEVDDSGMISSYQEKPVLDKWINIGYFYLEHEVLQWLDNFFSFEKYIEHLIEIKELNGYKHIGGHITVNNLKEHKNAEENIEKIYNK